VTSLAREHLVSGAEVTATGVSNDNPILRAIGARSAACSFPPLAPDQRKVGQRIGAHLLAPDSVNADPCSPPGPRGDHPTVRPPPGEDLPEVRDWTWPKTWPTT
jgi:hypothetical protein